MGDSYNLRIFIVLAMIMLASANVLAFAISAPYSKDNPLNMYPGETKEVNFVMQNLEGDGDVNAVVSLLEGREIAEITTGTNYKVTMGSSDTKIILKINVPFDTNIGKTYNVKFSVQSSPEGKEGNIPLGVGYNVDFPVTVVEKMSYPTPVSQEIEQAETGTSGVLIGLILLVIAIIIVIGLIMWMRKKKLRST